MVVDEVVVSVVGIEELVMLSDEVVSMLGVELDGKVSDEDDVVIDPANNNNNNTMIKANGSGRLISDWISVTEIGSSLKDDVAGLLGCKPFDESSND